MSSMKSVDRSISAFSSTITSAHRSAAPPPVSSLSSPTSTEVPGTPPWCVPRRRADSTSGWSSGSAWTTHARICTAFVRACTSDRTSRLTCAAWVGRQWRHNSRVAGA
eukprot:277867-Prymnesium_polylepis.1